MGKELPSLVPLFCKFEMENVKILDPRSLKMYKLKIRESFIVTY